MLVGARLAALGISETADPLGFQPSQLLTACLKQRESMNPPCLSSMHQASCDVYVINNKYSS